MSSADGIHHQPTGALEPGAGGCRRGSSGGLSDRDARRAAGSSPASARSAPSSGGCCDGEPPRGDGARQARLLVVPRDPRSRPWPRGAWRDPASWLTDAAFSMSPRGGRDQGALWGPFYQGPIPCVRAPPSGPSYLPKTPALNATAQGWSAQMDFGGHTVQAAGHHLIMPHLSSFTQSMRSRPPRPARGSRVHGEHGTLLAAAVPLRRIRAVFPASLAPLGWGRPRRVGC